MAEITNTSKIVKRDKALGILLPYLADTSGIFRQSYTTYEQIKTNLKNLLLTIKGERVMQPDFGTNIYKLLFENHTDDWEDELKDEIETAIGIWLPYIDLQDVSVKYANEYDYKLGIITVEVKYGLKFDYNFTDTISFKLKNNELTL